MLQGRAPVPFPRVREKQASEHPGSRGGGAEGAREQRGELGAVPVSEGAADLDMESG